MPEVSLVDVTDETKAKESLRIISLHNKEIEKKIGKKKKPFQRRIYKKDG